MRLWVSTTLAVVRQSILTSIVMFSALFTILALRLYPQTEALGKNLLSAYLTLLTLFTESITWALIFITTVQIAFLTFGFFLMAAGVAPKEADPSKPAGLTWYHIRFFAVGILFSGTWAFGIAILNTPKGSPAIRTATDTIVDYLPSCIKAVVALSFTCLVCMVAQAIRIGLRGSDSGGGEASSAIDEDSADVEKGVVKPEVC